MSATTAHLVPDEFKDAKFLALDPNKPYVVQVPTEADDNYISALSKNLSVAGIFAIILTTNVRFFSSFPIDITMKKREMEVDPSLLESDHAETLGKLQAPLAARAPKKRVVKSTRPVKKSKKKASKSNEDSESSGSDS